MNEEKFLLLEEALSDLHSAATHLRYSIDRTHNLLKQRDWQPEELERLESLASRFARLPLLQARGKLFCGCHLSHATTA
jgi:hypothetical protein